ncbi:hypothetical protein IQ63_34590 [Streptomyces acidiscabies]|uniref:AMP-dependent synthetase/ligase domain-containing protein n=1 Tax=Streptomyces acidiscabies TaxID=42234 RepID=A0A0L0JQT6_9ACTN|nr:AMP-binding protein [Streptomyces acidiscabies]KND27933.1 hypothetical protein IQ63_34590 [Streptomyces acidiscabies]
MTTLVDLFRASARRVPDGVALRGGGEEVTYAELDARSDRVARVLAGSGVGPGELVGAVVGRCVESVVTVLGILKSGAAYMPLDPAYPAERLRYVVADAGVRVSVGPRAREVPGVVLSVDGPGEGRPSAPSAGDPAYVIYTSGSTGRPKGCVVTHANVVALLEAALPLFGFGPRERWTLFHSLSFDFSVWEMWGAFVTGGRFVELLVEEGVTVLNQVPSVFRYTATAYREAGCPGLAVRWLVFGGEEVDLPVVREFLGEVGGVRPSVVNMYGITETTVHVTYKELDDAALADRAGVASSVGAVAGRGSPARGGGFRRRDVGRRGRGVVRVSGAGGVDPGAVRRAGLRRALPDRGSGA